MILLRLSISLLGTFVWAGGQRQGTCRACCTGWSNARVNSQKLVPPGCFSFDCGGWEEKPLALPPAICTVSQTDPDGLVKLVRPYRSNLHPETEGVSMQIPRTYSTRSDLARTAFATIFGPVGIRTTSYSETVLYSETSLQKLFRCIQKLWDSETILSYSETIFAVFRNYFVAFINYFPCIQKLFSLYSETIALYSETMFLGF